MIAKHLFRGDDDKEGFRKLRADIDIYQLHTNLISGGIGRLITEQPLINLINKHVGIGWKDTHFLSFSEDKKVALKYGMRCEIEEVEDKFEEHLEYYQHDSNWEFVLIEFSSDKITWHELEKGVYEGYYTPTLTKFIIHNVPYRILLVDVLTVLNNSKEKTQYAVSLTNATRDKEWLLLPATEIEFEFNQKEYSATLDLGCISNIFKYSSNFISEHSFGFI